MVAKGLEMEALSPRDANAQRAPRVNELKTKAAAQLKSAKDKEHPPPPPNNVTEPPSADRKEGAVYQVGKMLGKGGFAICYEGKLAGMSKRFALKIVKSQMPAKMEQKFQTELQIHSKMRQKNIVQFHRAFTFESCTYLVLELCPNGSLMDMVKRRKGLTEPEVRFYSIQIAGAIKYMHAKGIIHRDLKMGNIFLDKYMNAKIGDFGLAALLLTGKDMQIMRRTTLCGTPNYIAPEILEKGKKGHDHMVDIWSLGIIVFAMLTSKPPFQSSTTDEIYRRAKDRDYEWPSPETSQKYISQEAKDLVATMLQDADKRPDPDTIVEHPFFTSGYLPIASDISPKLRESPPQSPAFYDPPADAEMEALNLRNVQEMCQECGVGPWCHSQFVFKNIWREMAEEEQNGLTPAIPLAEGIVYRPFDEIRSEQKLQMRLAQQAQQAQQAAKAQQAQQTQQVQQAPQSLDKTDELSSFSQSIQSQRVTSGLLRAPPQSFAAQQRAQHRPANSASIFRSQSVAEPASKTAGSLRLRPQREVPVAPEQQPTEETAPRLRGTTTRSLRNQLTSMRNQPAPAAAEEQVPKKAPAPVISKLRVQEEKMSLFSPSEYQEPVPGTRPDVVLDRLHKLQAELERALNSRSMAILSSKDKTPSPPHIVVKWVDYTNKFGLGYILNDGSVGCILRGLPTQTGSQTGLLPPACMLVHGAERHCQRKEDPSYLDRHQIVPMNEGIYFYENNGAEGFSRVRASPETFLVPVHSDGTVGKFLAGKDIYDHRKRERIVLWKKFANYMITYGREMDGQVDESPIRAPTITDPTAAPSDIVTFYQRFGDVGCWMFCDGHMQFNFPDHTKIVLDSTATWCHFWHLPQGAAKLLEETGSLAESALDDRTVLSYPLQTLLNFATPPRAGTRSTSNPTRRRPEISPELQGIPAANHFRRKIEFIRDIIREWNANDGIGNSDMTRDKRLRWTGIRETRNVQIPAKHVWVTIGACWGDERLSAYVDPRKPAEMGPDIDESKKSEGQQQRQRS
ncbi:kinase-like domain-containing protein [Lasiosphaeria miniovina]|uniref:Kinase-like domain-containing protein n=1 Tax=Lasiosphaeria miniovina TaxID=1954250 RepID=A0AA40BH54_9PEZI|nr:kinase-like domain-containing protein [Lasiosphaeria miniovina]KAK0734145.1 kinase-like domain-containing protein [Lasiosphaeria miniovina]